MTYQDGGLYQEGSQCYEKLDVGSLEILKGGRVNIAKKKHRD